LTYAPYKLTHVCRSVTNYTADRLWGPLASYPMGTGCSRGRSATLNTHPYLVSRSRTSRRYTSSSTHPKHHHGVYREQLYSTTSKCLPSNIDSCSPGQGIVILYGTSRFVMAYFRSGLHNIRLAQGFPSVRE
jgi:hypothetical protein